MTGHSAMTPADRINPEVLEEARWFDGEPTMRDLDALATRRNLPLHVERTPPVYVAIPKRGPDEAALRTMLRAERFRANDLLRQAQDAWRSVRRIEARIAAMRGGE